MSTIAIVGTAHVVIRALTDKLQSDIQAGLNKSIAGAQGSGANAGKAFSDAFNSNGKIGIPSSFHNDAEKDGKRGGAVAGAAVGAGVAAGMAAGAAKGGQATVAAASRAGGSAGNVFGKMFNSSGGGPGRIFISMALRIAALLPLLGALVGGISSVVSGLFAMSAAANNALYAFAPLPGLVGALVQGGAVLMTAFSGVGAALSAGMKAATVPADQASKALDGLKNAARDAAEAVRDAAEAVSDAREAISDAAEGIRDAREAVRDAAKNLRDTEKQAAEAIVSANQAVADAKKNRASVHNDAAEAEQDAIEAVRDAELNLAKSHARVQKAQEALTDARKAAEERLLDLQFATRGGAIAEQRAIMALSDARYRLNATAELPPDNRLRQEAQLAYDEAQLNLEMTTERNGDTAESLEEIRRTGVDGTDEVVSAQERLVDAQDDVLRATNDVSDALANQVQVHADIAIAVREANEAVKEAKGALRDAYADAPEMISDAREALSDAKEALSDSKEALSDAQESLADAITALADAKKNVGAANAEFAAGIPEVNAYQDALDKLSPPARAFVEFLISIRERMGLLKTAAAAGLFPGLQTAIENLVYGPLFPAVQRMMFETGVAVANAAISISESLSSGPFVKNFGDVAEGNNRTIERMGLVIGDLAAALFAFMDAAQPVTDQLTGWLVQWADGVRKSTELGNANGTLSEKLLAGAESMKQLIRITQNLWEGFSDLGAIADESGQSLLDSFEKATEKFANFTDNKENVKQLRKDFDNIADNLRAISTLALAVGGAFFRLGADPAIGKIATQLTPVVETLETLITDLLDRIGDDLVLLVDQILRAFKEISKSGAIEVFLSTMSTALNILIGAFQTPVLGDGLRLLVKIGAAMYALSILSKFPGISLLIKILPTLAMLIGRVMLAMGPIGWIITAIGLLAIGFKILYEKSETFRNIVDPIFIGLQTALAVVGNSMAAFGGIVSGVFGAVVTAAKWLWDVLFGHSIFPDIQQGFELFFDAVGGIFTSIGNFFTKTIPDAATALFNWLGAQWTKVTDAIRDPVSAAVTSVKQHWNDIRDKFISVKDWVVNTFSSAWDRVRSTITGPIDDAKSKISGWFGEGGTVRGFFTGIKDWFVNTFSNIWAGIKLVIIGPIEDAKEKVFGWFGEGGAVRGFFTGIKDWFLNTFSGTWNAIENTIISPISAAVKSVKDFFDFTGEGGPVKRAFKDAVAGIGSIWVGLQSLLAKPVNFMIETVYNNGLRKALNLLPGVKLAPADPVVVPEVSQASGGILPGWSPGKDIHHFVSPTAGRLNLSGGEAIMRPEFARAVGGAGGVDALNKLAVRGKLDKRLFEQSHAAGGIVTIDGEPMSEIAARQYLLAEKLFGDMRIIQGSYQAASSYSGTSHTGGGVMDTSPGTFAAQAMLRKVGFAAWARNIPGAAYAGSGAHVHSVSMLDPTSAGHAQLASYARGEDGLGGRDYGPRPALLPNLSGMLGGIDISDAIKNGGGEPVNPGEDEKKNWLGIIKDFPGLLKDMYSSIKTMTNGDGYYPLMADAAKATVKDAIQWANDKIPDKIVVDHFPDIDLPDNPLSVPFDRGGVASGESDVWLPKRTARPERVLSPQQTESFDRLVALLEKNGIGNTTGGNVNLSVQVPQDASARDVVDGIVYEMRRMKLGGRHNG